MPAAMPSLSAAARRTGVLLLALAAAAPRAAGPASADIRVEVRADQPLAAQAWGNVQCDGRIVPAAAVPPDGLHGRPLPDGDTLRFGRVPDPDDPLRHALRFTLDRDDRPTAGSYRCELALGADAARGLPRDAAFWHAFAVRLPDLDGTTDDQAVAQWHAGDGGGLLPIATLLLRGRELRLVLRHDMSAAPTRATTVAATVWRSTDWAPGRWLRVVVQARLSRPSTDGGFFRAWLDGRPVVDRDGPLGYAHATVVPYVKHGVYHWVDAGNDWDPARPTRTVHLKHALLVADPAARYGAADLDAALAER